MHPPITYELKITFAGSPAEVGRNKTRLVDWLLLNGVESFVEGSLDCDINQNQDEPPRDHYGELGGDLTPVSVWRYSRESLDDLRARLAHDFRAGIAVELVEHPTEVWMEGWKESFKPFATARLWVRPPWEKGERPAGLTDVVVEPGMAFGTGQHATTRLCLEALERIAAAQGPGAAALARRTVLDVGTGTGILMIAARLLGYGVCAGTDIEEDAVLATVENAKLNQVDVAVSRGSIPERGAYDLVFANILAVTLLRLMDELAGVLAPGGSLVLSGLLVEEEAEIRARAEQAGLEVVESTALNGWACVVARRPAGR